MAAVTVADDARRLGVPPATLRRWARLAYGYLEELFLGGSGPHSRQDAADRTGLEPALVHRMRSSLGFPARRRDGFTEADLELLEYAAAVLSTGFPLVAGQAGE